jgi:hypothetical protein
MPRTGKRPFILPYEPDYTEHRTSQRHMRNAHILARLHMNALQSPSIAPDECPESGMADPPRDRAHRV